MNIFINTAETIIPKSLSLTEYVKDRNNFSIGSQKCGKTILPQSYSNAKEIYEFENTHIVFLVMLDLTLPSSELFVIEPCEISAGDNRIRISILWISASGTALYAEREHLI